MRIRKLESKDIEGILEWMKASDVNEYFRFDPQTMNEVTCRQFINNAQNTEVNYHLAVVDDNDEYLGTVSLKNINKEKKTGEFAIAMRQKARGTGAALFGTNEIIMIAFEQLGLLEISLEVYADNIRACKFYEKIGFRYVREISPIVVDQIEKRMKLYILTVDGFRLMGIFR